MNKTGTMHMALGYKIRKRALLGGFLILLATLFVQNLIHRAQHDRVASVVDTFSRVFKTKLEEQLHNRFAVIDLIRRNWEDGRMGNVDEFAAVAATVHLDFTDLQALNWVNTEGVIEKVTPEDGNTQVLGLNVANLDVPGHTLRDAEQRNAFRITPPITLAQGGLGFVGYAPVQVDGVLVGFMNLVFRSEPLIETAMGRGTADRFRITITDGDSPVFGNPLSEASRDFAAITWIDVAGRTWKITTAPTRSEIAKAQTNLDEFVLIFGIFMAIGVAVLLSETARHKETLTRSEERFALAMKGASDGLFDWNVSTGEIYFSPRWFQMLGYDPDELPSDFATFEGLLHPDDKPRVVKDGDTLDSIAGSISENEFRMRHKNGTWVNVLSRAYKQRREDRLVRVVGTHVDISELKRQQADLERAAMTDDLTGLCNRRGMSRLIATIAAELVENERLAIFHIDLDMFKSINDMNGHDAGDHVLKITARRLSAHEPRFDVAARVGGDEFLIAKKTARDDARVVATATRLIEGISQPIDFDGKLCRVGASIGIAFVSPGCGVSIEQTMANADIALNSSKSMGRGRCIIFEPHMRDEAVHSVEIATEIREGLGRDEFLPYFQPQVDMVTKEIIGFEALARWNHPQKGILGAADFVPFAENAHLVDAIDDQIFRKACRVVSQIGLLGAPKATVSVNLSTAQLCDPALVDRLLWTVDLENVEPSMICIEILEATLLSERTANVIRNVQELAHAGFGLELDDFGTGHTAIASLRNFPVSRIKIDKSLITDIDSDRSLQAITGAIIDLGKNLGINVLAEGIETEAELDYFASTACSQLQGFLIGHPMPFEDMRAWIRDWNSRHGNAKARGDAA